MSIQNEKKKEEDRQPTYEELYQCQTNIIPKEQKRASDCVRPNPFIFTNQTLKRLTNILLTVATREHTSPEITVFVS